MRHRRLAVVGIGKGRFDDDVCRSLLYEGLAICFRTTAGELAEAAIGEVGRQQSPGQSRWVK